MVSYKPFKMILYILPLTLTILSHHTDAFSVTSKNVWKTNPSFLELSFSNKLRPNDDLRRNPLKSASMTDLDAFADSLEDEEGEAALFDNDEDDVLLTWQESLEMLLDVNTPMAKRTLLLSDLVSYYKTSMRLSVASFFFQDSKEHFISFNEFIYCFFE